MRLPFTPVTLGLDPRLSSHVWFSSATEQLTRHVCGLSEGGVVTGSLGIAIQCRQSYNPVIENDSTIKHRLPLEELSRCYGRKMYWKGFHRLDRVPIFRKVPCWMLLSQVNIAPRQVIALVAGLALVNQCRFFASNCID
jgi:hypothetical protein